MEGSAPGDESAPTQNASEEKPFNTISCCSTGEDPSPRVLLQRSGSILKDDADVILITVGGVVAADKRFENRWKMALRSQLSCTKHWQGTKINTPRQLYQQQQEWSAFADNSLLE